MKEINGRIEAWVAECEKEFKEVLARIVKIRSVREEPEEGAPYGPGPKAVLNEALAICREYGFETKSYSDRMGMAELKPGAESELDILCHLDIVHEGTGWDSDPFTLIEKDGELYGRGVADNKGAFVMSLFALRLIRDLGLPIKGNARLIFGTDEECGSSDLPYFYNVEKAAARTFTPDIGFPVYNLEKGRLTSTIKKTFANEAFAEDITELYVGNTQNQVPELGEAKINFALSAEQREKLAALAAERNLVLSFEEGSIKLRGKSAHAANPSVGLNTLTGLLELITALKLKSPVAEAVKELSLLFPYGEHDGKSVGLKISDEISGELTLCPSILRFDGKSLSLCTDARLPLAVTREDELNYIKLIESRGFEVETEFKDAHYTPTESEFVQTLLEAYEFYTGLKGEALSTGGGTYVHNIEGGVGFGPCMPGYDARIHGANERLNLNDSMTAIKIFARVLASYTLLG